jgi:nucleotide-binding universal stress UspA family protein
VKALVAYRGSNDGDGALHLAAVLRRTTDAELGVVAVLPKVSAPSEADRDYARYLDSIAEDARSSAAAVLAPHGGLDFERVAATSVAAGLVEAAQRRGVDVLILGCARDAAAGNIVVGSVGERLLHSSPVPVLMSPHDYEVDADTRFTTLTCAYNGTDRAREALAASCDLASRYGLGLRIATFVPRAGTMYPPEVGLDAEDMVSAQYAEQAVGMHDDAVRFAKERGIDAVETVVARGHGWAGALSALEWRPDEMLVFGSSRLGALARVFLGSTASKIMRHTPVPVLLVPSGSFSWEGRPRAG